jgi:hypothetical protein
MTDAVTTKPRGVLLVGSVPLSNAEEVFRSASAILGDRLRRVPDGETGDRLNWIGWQMGVMARAPGLEPVPPRSGEYAALALYRLKPGASAADIAFGPLGYAGAALTSWETFRALKQAGEIPDHVRFQVSLPTPLAPVSAFIAIDSQPAVEPAYEQQLLGELDEICAAIPHDQLAIQWDVAVEFGLLEGAFHAWFADLETGIVERLVRVGNRVPRDVELGYHLCYGDYQHKHFKEPEDASRLVQLANAVTAGVNRPIQWVHLPVPRDRSDDAYFAPLRDLRLQPETELYLGLVHLTDGAEGTRARITAAQKVVTEFGVATECGLGRRPSETIPALLEEHAEVTDPVV